MHNYAFSHGLNDGMDMYRVHTNKSFQNSDFFTKPDMMPAIWRREATQRYPTILHIR